MKKKIAIETLRAFLKYAGLNTNELAKVLGMKRAQGLYDVLNPDKENVGISKNLAEKIVKFYPEINSAWLLTGSGEMLKADNTAKEANAEYKKQPLQNSYLEIIASQQRTIESQANTIASQQQMIAKMYSKKDIADIA